METIELVFLLFFAAIFASALLVWGVGVLLPREFVDKWTLKSGQPPPEVWKLLANHADEPSWWPKLKSVERLPDQDGKEVWRQTYVTGLQKTLRTEIRDAPYHLRRVLLHESGMAPGWQNDEWDFEIEPEGNGSLITLRCTWLLNRPEKRFLFRLVSFLFKVLGKSAGAKFFLQPLEAKLGEAAPSD
jgi:hypothetical protein